MKGRGNMINALKQKIKANLENYYQDKYVSKLSKENVNLVDYYNK